MVIHYVGDIHQPLHDSAEVDSRFPSGDQGGNFQKIPDTYETGVADLHAVWDSVIYSYPGYATLPMDKDTWEYFTAQSDKLENDHPIDQEKLAVTEFGDWAQESLTMAETLVYPGFVNGEVPS